MSDQHRHHELEDEREFLLRSLEDLDAEHDAGDLNEGDYVALRDSYTARAAGVLRTLQDHPGADEPPVEAETAVAADAAVAEASPSATARRGGRRSRRRIVIAAAVVVFVAVAAVAVVRATGNRLPGETVTGSVTLSPGRQLQRTLLQGETLEEEGNATEALQLYHEVLANDPGNVAALSETGWLEYQAGVEAKSSALLSDGQNDEERAQRDAPGQPAPHLYLGSMLLVDGDPVGAVGEFRLFLADSPSSAQLQAAAPFITRAYTEAGQKPPALPVS
jgi:tetratricopeptide (TPR) repeat protein